MPRKKAEKKAVEAKDSCGTCKFFNAEAGPSGHGDCRRYPQIQYKTDDQWCGEYQKK